MYLEPRLVAHRVSLEARVVGTYLEAKEVWEVRDVLEDREAGADLEAKEVGEVQLSLEVGVDHNCLETGEIQEDLQASLVVTRANGETMEVKGVSSAVAWVTSREQEECSEEEVSRADPSLDLEPQEVWRACPLLASHRDNP